MSSFRSGFFNRNSGAKGAAILIRIKHYSNQILLGTFSQGPNNLLHHRDVENIERRVSKRDARDPVVNVQSYVFVGVRHWVLGLWPLAFGLWSLVFGLRAKIGVV